MIAAVYTCKNEIDIVEASLRHMLAEGIDTDDDQYVDQPGWTNRLAHEAGRDGATWILPCDIDEFMYATNGDTIAKVLHGLGPDAMVLDMWAYQHLNWDTRFVEPHGNRKVAYRYDPSANVTWGSHAVYLAGGRGDGVLNIREIQYRSFEHFCAKALARQAHLSPADKAQGVGGHHSRLEGWSEDEMRAEWERLISVPMIHDPIPTHCPVAKELVRQ